jgi:hypothetical protein
MNERIRELAEQAGVGFMFDPDAVVLAFKMEKFAELIVRECIKKCKDHPSIIFKNEWDADVVAPDIVSRLESHFGVEE